MQTNKEAYLAASQKPLQTAEKQAMREVRREFGSGVSAEVFEICWRRARDGALLGYGTQDFGRTGVRAEAVEAVRDELADVAREAQRFLPEEGQDAGRRLRDARRPQRRERDEDAVAGSQELTDSTVLRTEAMALLITELAAEREDVRDYRGKLPGGLLAADHIDDYLENLNEDEGGELLDIAVDVCNSYGLHLGQSSDLILAATPPELQPILRGPPRTGPTVCQMQFSFAPWASPEDAAAALRRAQLRAAALREHQARAEKAKRKAMARFEAGENTRRGPRAWRSDPALKPFRKRRPRLDVSGKRVSAPEADSLRLFIFVSRRRSEAMASKAGGRQTWGDIKTAWNALQEEEGGKRYADEHNLSKIYRRTRAALTAWLPTPRPRLVLEEG